MPEAKSRDALLTFGKTGLLARRFRSISAAFGASSSEEFTEAQPRR